jgi:two-component system sensor histidine kinase YesM
MKPEKRHSIRNRLYMLSLGLLIPFVLVAIYLTISLIRLTDSYDQIVRNITIANNYNIEFKKDYDYVVYRMVISSVNAADAETKLQLRNPYDMIDEMISGYQSLQGHTTVAENERRITSILKMLTNLKKYTKTIDDNITTGGMYDVNNQMLDLDIRNVTELVLEKTQEYIYYEAAAMEKVRQELQSGAKQAVTLTVIVLMAAFLWVIILMRRMMNDISGPIGSLCDMTKQVANGNFEARAETGNVYEIQVLNESFNSMTEQIGELIKNIKTEQDNQRKTELKLLQVQINPHFLYNTLDTISWLAEAGEKKQVVSMVSSLSDFFRTTLSQGRDFITIKEEELHVRSYLEIQQFRYQDILTYDIRFPEELYMYTILKLTLQPIVENALYHGIKNKRGKGTIRVCAELTDEGRKIRITVADDGIGMTGEELDHLRMVMEGKISAETESHGFGLRNVNERIRLNYGMQYGLSVDSTYGEGTLVTVLIPAEKHANTSHAAAEPEKDTEKIKQTGS